LYQVQTMQLKVTAIGAADFDNLRGHFAVSCQEWLLSDAGKIKADCIFMNKRMITIKHFLKIKLKEKLN